MIDHGSQAHHQRDYRGELVQDGLMTIREAVAFLRLGRSTLYGLMERGDLPYACIGARRLIPRRAIVDLAARNLRCEIPIPPANNGKRLHSWPRKVTALRNRRGRGEGSIFLRNDGLWVGAL